MVTKHSNYRSKDNYRTKFILIFLVFILILPVPFIKVIHTCYLNNCNYDSYELDILPPLTFSVYSTITNSFPINEYRKSRLYEELIPWLGYFFIIELFFAHYLSTPKTKKLFRKYKRRISKWKL